MEAIHKHTKKTFLSGVLLLSISTLLVKIIGLIYKMPMLTYLGSEGMGYFNSAYEIYALFCVIATAGLPVALSVLIAEALAHGNYGRVRRVYRASMTVFLWIGVLGTLLMLVFAGQFCRLIKSENAYLCILSIAPTVFFVCVSSALRGYFQGHQRMLPTAISQLLESLGKLIFGLLFARFALQRGYATPTVAAFAGVGLTLGSAVSTLYLVIEKYRFRTEEGSLSSPKSTENAEKYREIWKRLAALAVPMTLGASLVSLTKLIDMTMILRRLQAIGYTETLANEAYGSYTTLALSVYGLLPALVNAVAMPLLPMLTAAIASGERERQAHLIRSSYRLTAIFAIPSALGIAAFAHPILSLLFGHEPGAVAVAAPLLSNLGLSVFLSCMITATNSVLHAYRAVNRPILSMLAGAIVKIVSAYFLIGLPSLGLAGAPISTLLCNATVVLFNLWFSARLCHVERLGEVFWRPLLSSVLSVGAALGVYLQLSRAVSSMPRALIPSLLTACAVYLVTSCLLGVVRDEDVRLLPFGEGLCRILKRVRLLPRKNDEKLSERNQIS